MDALKKYRANPTLAAATGRMVSSEDIRADYGGDSTCALQCRGKFLTDAVLYLEKETLTRMEDCPYTVLEEDTCGSKVIVDSF